MGRHFKQKESNCTMLSRFSKKHPIWFSILVIALFLVVNVVASSVWYLCTMTSPMTQNADAYDYLGLIVTDAAVIAVMLLILWRTHRLNLMKGQGASLRTCVSVSAFKLVYTALLVVMIILDCTNNDMTFRPFGMILLFIFLMFVVAMAEELMCRAIISETMLEHFGLDAKSVRKAALLSGALFGCLHLLNALSSDPLAAIGQSFANIAAGFMLAAIYFRSGSMWTVVIVHALNNIGAAMANGFFEIATEQAAEGATVLGSAVNDLQLATVLVQFVLQMIVGFFLLRDKKNPDVQKLWSKQIPAKTADAEQAPAESAEAEQAPVESTNDAE